MRNALLVLVLVSLALAAALVAPAQDAPAPRAASPAHGGSGSFKATLAIVRADKALDFWYRTAESGGPHFALVERVNPNDRVLLLVMFEGLGDVGGGQGKVTLNLSSINPSGATDVLAHDLPAWEGPLPGPGIIVMTRAVPEYSLDEKEPLGTTTIVAEAHDEGSGQSARCEARLELVPWSYGDAPADDAACEQWMWEYYRAPKPGQAVRAYLEYAHLENRDGKSLNFAMVGFFLSVFRDSPWLVDHLVGRFDSSKPEQGTKIVLLLHLLGQQKRIEALPLVSDKLREKLDETFAHVVLPDPYAEITGAEQLDLLWGEFLATGRYAPVRQIITALGLAPFEDAIEAFSRSKQTEQDKERFFRGVTFRAARWSLDSNMERHPLVAAYARYAAQHEELGQDERAQLEALLAKHDAKPAGDAR